jgi:orotidine-5'-phosphate decarboxylase
MMQAKDRIILALDVDSREKALALVDSLKDYVGLFKIGMQLYNLCGPDIVRELNARGSKVFVDLKFHDIPNTVASASRVMTQLEAFMFNMHASGGYEMMAESLKATQDEANQLGIKPPLVIAVTALTSLSNTFVEEMFGVKGVSVEELVKKWSKLAQKAGLDGVVCSPLETAMIRKECGPDFKIVNPGIRPAWAAKNDQKRFTTPRQAIDNGADFIVIGRPITAASNPQEAAQKIIAELEA